MSTHVSPATDKLSCVLHQPMKKPTICERISTIFALLFKQISSLFSRKPNPTKLLKERVEQLSLVVSDLIKKNETLYCCIRINVERIQRLESHASLSCSLKAKPEESIYDTPNTTLRLVK